MLGPRGPTRSSTRAFEEVFGCARRRRAAREPRQTVCRGRPVSWKRPRRRGRATTRGAAVEPSGWSDARAAAPRRLRRRSGPRISRASAALMAALARRGPMRRSRRRRLRRAPPPATPRVDVRAHDPRVDALRRRAAAAALARARASARGASSSYATCRGSMRPYAAGPAALRAGARRRAPRRRGVRLRHAADARDARAAHGATPSARSRGWARSSRTGRGGTRIGESLRTLNREHGGRVGRGATVIVLSDGWDRGATDELAAELARLRAHRPPPDLAQPAEGATRLRAARQGDGRRRSRTSTCSSPATRSPASRSSPCSSRPALADQTAATSNCSSSVDPWRASVDGGAAGDRVEDLVEVAGADLALVARGGVAVGLERELGLLQLARTRSSRGRDSRARARTSSALSAWKPASVTNWKR